MRRLPVLASLLLALLLGPIAASPTASGAAAQTGTPAAGLPAAPDPVECTVPSRSLASVEAALGSAPAEAPGSAAEPDAPAPEPPPDAAPAEPDAEPAPEPGAEPEPLDPERGGPPPVPIGIELPPGEPADAATTAAVTATLRLFVACANAGDVARMYALVTDEFLRQSVGNQPLTEAVTDYLAATPTPRPPATRTTLVAVREVRLLPDGRVGALVDNRDPTHPRGASLTTDFATFVEQDGRYLLDAYLSGIEAVYGPLGTPTP
jgi:hypothetical protein